MRFAAAFVALPAGGRPGRSASRARWIVRDADASPRSTETLDELQTAFADGRRARAGRGDPRRRRGRRRKTVMLLVIRARAGALLAGDLALARPQRGLDRFRAPREADPDEDCWAQVASPARRRMAQCRREQGDVSRRRRAHAGRGGLDCRRRPAAGADLRRAAEPRGAGAAGARSPPPPKACAAEHCRSARRSRRGATSSIAWPKA